MKKILLALLLVSVVLVAACSQTKSGTTDKTPTGTDTTTGSSTNDNPATGGAVKKFTMTAKQWEFSPSTITVSEGDEVELSIKSIDVNHGFGLPTFGVSETIEAGKTTVVKFTASKKGTFTFFCNVKCGQGHKDMKGTLIVQ